MKIAVTGANGFVGREVLRQLPQAGHSVVPLVRSASGLPGEVVTGNLDEGRLSAQDLAGCDAVIHLAARTHVMNETESDPLPEYRRANVEGTDRLLDAALAAGVGRVVFMSSVKAVGERSAPGAPLGPDTPPEPEDAYGQSKREAEGLVQQRCEAAGIGWTIIRPPLVHGEGAQGNLQRLVRLIERGLPLPFGAVRNARSIVSVRNLAAAAIAATDATDAAGRVLHIADLTVSTPELIRELGRAVGRKPLLVPVPPALMTAVASVLGRGAEVQRLFGSLELETASSWGALGLDPPFDPREQLRASIRS
ncbi:NAD-dependent epimerase/dehydratase family protein [Pseudoblastomonas halimionae]|uniref:NAD-dependent epimerase/dehydratase family protein n=1 Tax=Alteriqipengyuania halimionae TaxID=1926630 RepID=A0A6I4U9K1_9SPHN|nr:NAD-dependent epimerase/dehydratase family protein [Alteriqipengyuania halimionae]MXP10921.1 NAD-dependent epimerase/dehydratase family protein [Alteriqipengyuania halimionae]